MRRHLGEVGRQRLELVLIGTGLVVFEVALEMIDWKARTVARWLAPIPVPVHYAE